MIMNKLIIKIDSPADKHLMKTGTESSTMIISEGIIKMDSPTKIDTKFVAKANAIVHKSCLLQKVHTKLVKCSIQKLLISIALKNR